MNYQALEQEQLIGYWAKKTYGVKAKEFLYSPFWEDIKLLLQIRNEFDREWNTWEHANWSSLWGMVAQQGYPLKGKHIRKLDTIVRGILSRRTKKQQQRQRIKALKEPLQKTDYNMTAKESVADVSPPWGA
jgi:hypothetical protein